MTGLAGLAGLADALLCFPCIDPLFLGGMTQPTKLVSLVFSFYF